MEYLAFAAMVIGGWWLWKHGRDDPKPKDAIEPIVQKEVESLRKLAGNADKTPYTPPKQPPTPTRWTEPAPVKSGLKYLRHLCREARLDAEITEGEARKLLQAFAEFESHQTKIHTHAHYVLGLLRECLADGRLEAHEAQDLLTAVGEFADADPPPVMPVRPTPPPSTARPEQKLRKRGAATKPRRSVSLTPGQEYELTYTDAYGDVSERVIRLNGLSGSGETQYLEAYCNKARGHRTFRIDRIQSLVDMSTGEIMISS